MIRRCLVLLALGVSSQELDETCDLQLLQVSQTLETSRTWMASFMNVLGQAQTDRILTPAVTGSAALVEIADLAVAQQGTKATELSAATICVIVAAVCLAVLVCLIFSCFKPSTSYDSELKLQGASYEQGAASSSLDRAMRKDCC